MSTSILFLAPKWKNSLLTISTLCVLLMSTFSYEISAQVLNFPKFENSPDNYGWNYSTNSVEPIHTISEGVLIQNTMGKVNAYGFYYLEKGAVILPNSNWTIKFRANVLDSGIPASGFFTNVIQNELLYSIRITKDAIFLLNENNNEYNIINKNNTGFHDYQVTGAVNTGLLITVDGVDLGEALPVPISSLPYNTGYELAFGDGTTNDSVNAHVELANFSFSQSETEGLVASYTFHGNAKDQSGFGNDGEVFGAQLVSDRFQNQNEAYYFDGIDDHIIVPDNDLLSPINNAISISLWAKPKFPTNRFLIYKGSTLNNREYAIGLRSDSLISFQINGNGSATEKNGLANVTLMDGETWHHIVGTWNGYEQKIYVDGIIITTEYPQLKIGNYNSDLFIGTYGGDISEYAFHGIIDDLNIYNIALTEKQIMDMYLANGIITDFTVDSTFGKVPFTVQFSDKSISLDSNYAISSWQWDFDEDGLTDSEEENPEWTYENAGIYSVKLTVSNSQDTKSEIKEELITIAGEQATIISISDAPNDQGRWVKVDFLKSLHDTDTLTLQKNSSSELYTIEQLYDSVWVSVASTSAYGKIKYSALVPTFKDSNNTSEGLINFRIISSMGEGNYVSDLKTGYSVDNIEPHAPSNLIADGESIVKLFWESNNEEDFHHYSIYKDSRKDFIPNPENFLVQTHETSYIDDFVLNGSYYYKISATDINGNESEFTDISVLVDLESEKQIINNYSLEQNYPNPFNPKTNISYSIKYKGQVELSLYNSLGEKISLLVNKVQNPGEYKISFNAENLVSGIYFYSIKSREYHNTKKMILLK